MKHLPGAETYSTKRSDSSPDTFSRAYNYTESDALEQWATDAAKMIAAVEREKEPKIHIEENIDRRTTRIWVGDKALELDTNLDKREITARIIEAFGVQAGSVLALLHMSGSMDRAQSRQKVETRMPEVGNPDCLVLGYDAEDSFLNIRELGLKQARHVDGYRDMLKYTRCPVYITERGRDRPDFGAIEGLFIQGKHRVIDLME